MNELTKEEIDLLVQNKIIPEGTPIAQIQFFSEVCKRKKLDPFLRQVHMVERKEQKDSVWKKSYTIQASLDGMRAISQRNGKIKSVKRGVKKENDELYGWCEIMTKDGGIYYDEVPFSEYVQKRGDGTITHFWKQFPQTMIKKVAEESVRRMADPEDLSGIYGDTEMLLADNSLDIAEKSSVKMPEVASDMKPEPEIFLSSDMKPLEVQGDMQVVEEIQEGKPNIIISKEDEKLYAEPTKEWTKGLTPEIVREIEADSIEMTEEEREIETKKWMAYQEEEKKKEKEIISKSEDDGNIGMPTSEFEKKQPVDFHYANECRKFKKVIGEKVYYDLLNTFGRAKHSTDLKGASKIKFLRTLQELAIKAGWKEEKDE